MELDYKVYRIHLNHTFGLSRSKNDWYDIIILYLIDGEFVGRGEAAPSVRYNESSDRILSVLKNKITLPDDCSDREIIWNHILPDLEGIKALELIQRSMQQTAPNAQASSPSKVTIEDVMAKMRDPRYYDPARRDKAYVQEITDGFKRI